MRVLLVEDDARLAGFTVKGLEASGFTADAVHSGEDAEAALAVSRYDAIVLDLGLPDTDGMRLLRDLRRAGRRLPVLVLTARDGIGDRVAGLDAGADDYLLKPFAMAELMARLRAILRRPDAALGTTLTAGNLALDTAARELRVEDKVVPVTRRELDLLEQLLRQLGRVVSKTLIDERIYGYGEEGSANSVEAMASRLRRSLRTAGASVQILTFRGVGYMLQAAA